MTKPNYYLLSSDTLLFSAHSSINFNKTKTNRESEYEVTKVSRWKKGMTKSQFYQIDCHRVLVF